MISTVVWGIGNVGRAAIRAVHAHPGLELTAVVVRDPEKVGRDAGDVAQLGSPIGLAATDDLDAVLATRPRAVFYAVTGDGRDREASAELLPLLSAGCAVVTTSLYALYDPRNAPAELLEPLNTAISEGGGRLFVNGVDPGWGNDILPALVTGVATAIDVVRCREIFDYSTYDAEDSVRYLVGMGQPMDYEPIMTAATIPTMIWGGRGPDARPRPRRRARRDPRDARPPRARRDRHHEGDGRLRGRHPGRGALRGPGDRRRRAADRDRARHPHPPERRPRLATGAQRHRRAPRRDRGSAAHRADDGGHRRGRQRLGRWQRHRGRASRQRARLAGRSRARRLRRLRRPVAARDRTLGSLTCCASTCPRTRTRSASSGARWCPRSVRPRPASRSPSTPTRRSACASSRRPGSGWRRSTVVSSASTGARTATARPSRTPSPTRSPSGGPPTRSTSAPGWRPSMPERYALAHHGLDDDFWERMHAAYGDAEIVELSMCPGSWLAFGRLNHVPGIDGVCVLPSTLQRKPS
ncbi:hypothetical protein LP418_10300 [Nocardioides sp. B-3]|nr:hypothetical protein [Nocardioides sp. B-3]UUZ61021.1 hypothetical protein LP418_10300 [Nocardioides sp. B-3]